ncbi:MAG: hypothetical protein AB1918_10785 [Pseudomonadota bacterium]
MRLENTSGRDLACWIEGASAKVVVKAGDAAMVPAPVGEVACEGVGVRGLAVDADGPDALLILNGQQTRSLSALMYSYIPSGSGGFAALSRHIVTTFQAANPEILLNVSYTPRVNRYDFATLEKTLAADEYHVMEIDTLFLGHLAGKGLVVPPDGLPDVIPVARAAVTVGGKVQAVPTWLCTEVLHSPASAPIAAADIAKLPDTAGDFGGRWFPLQSFIKADISRSKDCQASLSAGPPDPGQLDRLAKLISACPPSTPGGRCTKEGFSTALKGGAKAVMGFTENARDLGMPGKELTAAPVSWGRCTAPILYADALVVSRAACRTETCLKDAKAFQHLMAGPEMAAYTALARDEPTGSPPRWLLSASRAFWDRGDVLATPLYREFRRIVGDPRARAFPNAISRDRYKELSASLCASLRGRVRDYPCKPLPKD